MYEVAPALGEEERALVELFAQGILSLEPVEGLGESGRCLSLILHDAGIYYRSGSDELTIDLDDIIPLHRFWLAHSNHGPAVFMILKCRQKPLRSRQTYMRREGIWDIRKICRAIQSGEEELVLDPAHWLASPSNRSTWLRRLFKR